MRLQLEHELYEIDPIFFQQAIACEKGQMTQMDTCMAFGLECEDGWFEPIKKMVKKISILNELGKKYNLSFVCNQLKQKYGQFNCYTRVNYLSQKKQEVQTLIQMFNQAKNKCLQECYNICQFCGSKEDIITTSGWIRRICRKCAKECQQESLKRQDERNKSTYNPRIEGFRGAYDYLNLYHRYLFVHKQRYYTSLIHAIYSIKDEQHSYLYDILSSNKIDPRLIQNVGKKLFNIEITQKDYQLIKQICISKFGYNKYIKEMLLQTNDLLLTNTTMNHDNIMSRCICQKCRDKQYKDLYAKILMQVRQELKK